MPPRLMSASIAKAEQAVGDATKFWGHPARMLHFTRHTGGCKDHVPPAVHRLFLGLCYSQSGKWKMEAGLTGFGSSGVVGSLEVLWNRWKRPGTKTSQRDQTRIRHTHIRLHARLHASLDLGALVHNISVFRSLSLCCPSPSSSSLRAI